MLLAIGTAHRACSLALVEGGDVLRAVHEEIGRGHAERLIPMIAEMLDGTRPDHIVVEVGPGSFTGIRVGVAAARALGLAWGAQVTGMTSTSLLAAEAFAAADPPGQLAVILDGGRGEVFVQQFSREGAEDEVTAVAYDDIRLSADAAIGTGTALIALPDHIRDLGGSIPTAAYAARLKPAERELPPSPLYIRPPDAKPSLTATGKSFTA
ncbi:MAG: tRNA (adenosine(37)-N6)-threonylcarbamoyltransferase complex dimerization subunit type 1 TsaB [Pacificimonas sp.]